MKKFITHTRYKGDTISGHVNIPAMTEVEERNGLIFYQSLPICTARSAVGTSHFCRNDDGNGMERGSLTMKIVKALVRHGRNDEHNDILWERVWNDERCNKYKRATFDDHWLWDYEFYQAPLEDLRYILHLICQQGG